MIKFFPSLPFSVATNAQSCRGKRKCCESLDCFHTQININVLFCVFAGSLETSDVHAPVPSSKSQKIVSISAGLSERVSECVFWISINQWGDFDSVHKAIASIHSIYGKLKIKNFSPPHCIVSYWWKIKANDVINSRNWNDAGARVSFRAIKTPQAGHLFWLNWPQGSGTNLCRWLQMMI